MSVHDYSYLFYRCIIGSLSKICLRNHINIVSAVWAFTVLTSHQVFKLIGANQTIVFIRTLALRCIICPFYL